MSISSSTLSAMQSLLQPGAELVTYSKGVHAHYNNKLELLKDSSQISGAIKY